MTERGDAGAGQLQEVAATDTQAGLPFCGTFSSICLAHFQISSTIYREFVLCVRGSSCSLIKT